MSGMSALGKWARRSRQELLGVRKSPTAAVTTVGARVCWPLEGAPSAVETV